MPYNPKSVSDWQPSMPKSGEAVKEKLMKPNAHDAPDTMTGSNVRKQFMGGSGKPSGELGRKGREF